MAHADRSPYVGPRPYARGEEDLFCGRERETRDLRSLVLAHPVVLVYAPSGAGKSSLLNAGLVPRLVDRGCEVLPSARVSGRLPASIAPDAVPNLAVFNVLSGWAGPNATAAALTAETIPGFLAQRPHANDEEGEPTVRIAILDQFEELFTFAPERWRDRPALFEQLALALAADPLLRVVIAMREDFIANLDGFAQLLPQALRTRYHIDPLSAEAARMAIEEPLKKRGCMIRPVARDALVEELLKIHVKRPEGDLVEAEGPFVEPVQLQVVCRKLWTDLPEGVTEIDAAQLAQCTSVDDALGGFYDEEIARTARETALSPDIVRSWVDTHLITPGGTRGLVYRGESTTGGDACTLPNVAVDSLAAGHLIRAEVRAGGERWYELCHDRFITPVRRSNRAWKQNTQRRQRRRRIRKTVFLGAGAAIAALLLYTTAQECHVYLNADRKLNRLISRMHTQQEPDRAKVLLTISTVSDFLWRRNSDRDLRRLETLLRRQDLVDLIRDSAASAQKPTPIEDLTGAQHGLPFHKVLTNPTAPLEQSLVDGAWSEFRPYLVSKGLVVPDSIPVEPDHRVPADEIRSAGPNGRSRTLLALPPPEYLLTVSEMGLAERPRLQAWFVEHQSEWVKVDAPERGGPWWFVPAWSKPIFETAGHRVHPREYLVAVAFAEQFMNDPGLAVDATNTAALLARVAETHPQTVAEALRACGGIDKLVPRLQMEAREGRTLSQIVRFLDEVPQADALAPPTPPDSPPPTDDNATDPAKGTTGGSSQRYQNSIANLALQPPVRVYLGDDWLPVLTTADQLLKPELMESLRQSRAAVFKRIGCIPPGVRFSVSRDDPDGPTPNQAFRIELLGQPAARDFGVSEQPIATTDGALTIPALTAALQRCFLLERRRWITAEWVFEQLQETPEHTREWLGRKFSLTSLKILFREFLAPLPAAPQGPTGNARDIDPALPKAGQSVRHARELLGALVFWTQAVSTRDPVELAGGLSGTIVSDDHLPGLQPRSDLEREIAAGIDGLDRDDPDGAAEHFRKAIATDHDAAITAFQAAFAHRGDDLTRLAARIRRYCEPSQLQTFGWLPSRAPSLLPERYRLEIEDFLETNRDRLATADRLVIEFRLLEDYLADGEQAKADAVIAALRESTDQMSMTPDQQFEIGYWLLQGNGAQSLSPREPVLAEITRRLEDAFRRWPPEAESTAEAAFTALVEQIGNRNPPPWHLRLLERMGAVRLGSAKIPLQLGALLSGGRTAEEADRARDWLNRARQRLAAGQQGRRIEPSSTEAWIRFYSVQAVTTSAQFMEAEPSRHRLEEAAAELRSLISALHGENRENDTAWPTAPAYACLIGIHLANRDQSAAEVALAEAQQLKGVKDSIDLLAEWFAVELAAGRIDQALQVADNWRQLHPTSADAIYCAALAQLLTGEPDAEFTARDLLITTSHHYSDYIRLLLYWRLMQEGKGKAARAYLEDRWNNIDRKTWAARLADGDEQVWREQLIAYYLGAIERSTLFEPLATREAFAASPLSSVGVEGLTYEGLLAEAYFYDALLQQVSGDSASQETRARTAFQRVRDLGRSDGYEFHMAGILLGAERSAAAH